MAARKGNSFAFDCFKKGHKPMDGVPSDVFILGGFPHQGAVCQKCKGVYYIQLSDKKVDDIPAIVNVEGKRIVSDN